MRAMSPIGPSTLRWSVHVALLTRAAGLSRPTTLAIAAVTSVRVVRAIMTTSVSVAAARSRSLLIEPVPCAGVMATEDATPAGGTGTAIDARAARAEVTPGA